MRVSRAWYGGLRNLLRRVTDPEIDDDEKKRAILTSRDCYYRYTVIWSFMDIQDVLFFLASRYRPGNNSIKSSGRYEELYVEERSPDKIVTVD